MGLTGVSRSGGFMKWKLGDLINTQVQPGGMVASSGIAIQEMGDTNDDMVIVVASVTVGY